MKIPTLPNLRNRWLALVTLLVATLLATTAFAYGRVQWKSMHLKEDVAGTQSSWKIEMTFYLDKPPDMATIPVKFEFKPTMYYERYQDDSSPGVQIRKVPLQNRDALIESVDLGFLDPGTGVIENRTRFAFRITRAHGFDAGEYRVTIRDGRNGNTIGTAATLILEGENEIIDRRAIVIQSKDDKKVAKSDEEKKAQEDAASEGEGSDGPASSGSEDMDWSEVQHRDQPLPPPGSVHKHGACGCRTVGTPEPLGFAVPALLGLAFVGRRLARRRRAA